VLFLYIGFDVEYRTHFNLETSDQTRFGYLRFIDFEVRPILTFSNSLKEYQVMYEIL